MDTEMMYEDERKKNSLKEILSILFKHKRKVVGTFAVIALSVTAVTQMIHPVYEAKSTMLVKMGREYLNRPEVGDNKPVMSLGQAGVISSEIQIISNREMVEKVIKTMGIENIYPDLARNASMKISPLEVSVIRFEKGLKVEGLKNSSVIQVNFQHRDPRVAAKAVNLLVDFYKEKHLQVFNEPTASYLEQQLVGYTEKLKESEKNLEDYKQKNRVFSLEEQRSLLFKQRMEMDTALKNSTSGISELQKRVGTLRGQLKTLAASDTPHVQPDADRNITETKSKLLALQLNEQELLKKYTENNRLVVNVRNEIELVKDFIKKQEAEAHQRARTGSSLYQDIKRELLRAESDLHSLVSKAASIRGQLATVDGSIHALNLTEQQLERLKRDKVVNEKNYQSFQERTEESRRLDEMNRLKLANISVIQPAAPPVEPIKPKKSKIILAGILVGIVFGVGSAFLSEHASQRFTSPRKVEEVLGLPVLLSIPYYEN